MQYDYSILVPVYNSSDTIIQLVDKTVELFQELKYPFEIILVDDGSENQTWEILKSIKQKHPQTIKCIRLNKNYGQHNALFCGMMHANANFVVTLDDDLQVHPIEIKKLIEKQKATNADVVYGNYNKKQHSFLRNLGSWYIKVSGKFFSNYTEKGSSFRLISNELIKKFKEYPSNFVFIDELIFWYATNIQYQDVNHFPQKKSRYTFLKLVKLTFKIVYNYTDVPLKMMVYGGMFSSLVCLIIGLYFIYRKITHNVPLGYTSLIVAILFSTSILLFSIGIIGEYLKRIIAVQNKKPPFTIKEII